LKEEAECTSMALNEIMIERGTEVIRVRVRVKVKVMVRVRVRVRVRH